MADENEVMLRGKLLTEFRVVDLKKELKIRSLSQIGSKNQLISRLKQHLLDEQQVESKDCQTDDSGILEIEDKEGTKEEMFEIIRMVISSQNAKAPNIALQNEQSGNNDFIKQYLEQQQRNMERQIQHKKELARYSTESNEETTEEEEMTSVSNQKDTHVSATVENIKTKMTKSLKRQNDTNESKGDSGEKHSEHDTSKQKRSHSPRQTWSKSRSPAKLRSFRESRKGRKSEPLPSSSKPASDLGASPCVDPKSPAQDSLHLSPSAKEADIGNISGGVYAAMDTGESRIPECSQASMSPPVELEEVVDKKLDDCVPENTTLSVFDAELETDQGKRSTEVQLSVDQKEEAADAIESTDISSVAIWKQADGLSEFLVKEDVSARSYTESPLAGEGGGDDEACNPLGVGAVVEHRVDDDTGHAVSTDAGSGELGAEPSTLKSIVGRPEMSVDRGSISVGECAPEDNDEDAEFAWENVKTRCSGKQVDDGITGADEVEMSEPVTQSNTEQTVTQDDAVTSGSTGLGTVDVEVECLDPGDHVEKGEGHATARVESLCEQNEQFETDESVSECRGSDRESVVTRDGVSIGGSLPDRSDDADSVRKEELLRSRLIERRKRLGERKVVAPLSLVPSPLDHEKTLQAEDECVAASVLTKSVRKPWGRSSHRWVQEAGSMDAGPVDLGIIGEVFTAAPEAADDDLGRKMVIVADSVDDGTEQAVVIGSKTVDDGEETLPRSGSPSLSASPAARSRSRSRSASSSAAKMSRSASSDSSSSCDTKSGSASQTSLSPDTNASRVEAYENVLQSDGATLPRSPFQEEQKEESGKLTDDGDGGGDNVQMECIAPPLISGLMADVPVNSKMSYKVDVPLGYNEDICLDAKDVELPKVESRLFRRLGIGQKSEKSLMKIEDSCLQSSEELKEKPVRKRKWVSCGNSITAHTSLEISTDSLKGLIDEVKLPLEPVLELDASENILVDSEDSQQPPVPLEVGDDGGIEEELEEVNRDDLSEAMHVSNAASVIRTVILTNDEEKIQITEEKVTVGNTSETGTSHVKEKKAQLISREKNRAPSRSKEKKPRVFKDKENVAKKPAPVKKVKNNDRPKPTTGLTPLAVLAVEEPERPSRQQSPPRKPVSRIVHIINLVRPFTAGQLKQLLGRTGTLVEDGFWINSIKSHCYVTYEKKEQAVSTRRALHGARWPSSNPKTLRVEFADRDEMNRRRSEEEGVPPPPLMKPAMQKDSNQGGDEAGVPQPAQPPSPQKAPSLSSTDRQLEDAGKRHDRPMEAHAVREWDRGKASESAESAQLDRLTSRERPRERERERHHREQERVRDRKQKRQLVPDKPAVEPPPAKLLDDLFRKSKATPCIYWLPLTEDQAKKLESVRKEKLAACRKKEQEEAEKMELRREPVNDDYRRDFSNVGRQRVREGDRLLSQNKWSYRERDRPRELDRGPHNDRNRRSGGVVNSGSVDQDGGKEQRLHRK